MKKSEVEFECVNCKETMIIDYAISREEIVKEIKLTIIDDEVRCLCKKCYDLEMELKEMTK